MTTNTLVRDLNVAVSRFDDRRFKVIANGFPLRNGAQLANIVFPPTAAGEAVVGATRPDPCARCRLVVIGVEVRGRWGSKAASFLRLLARARARAAPEALRPAVRSA